MRDRRSIATFAAMTDTDLERALRDLAVGVAWPRPAAVEPGAPDLARRTRLAIQESGVGAPRRAWDQWLGLPSPRPLRRALALALVAILVVAALAAALGIGVPGIRIFPAPPTSPPPSLVTAPTAPSASPRSAAPTPSPRPSEIGVGLGNPIPVDTAAAVVDFPLLLPPAPLGAPTRAFVLDGRLSLVWQTGPDLPPMSDPTAGLLLTEFRGSIDSGYFSKIIDQGTTVTSVEVGEAQGYWISGDPHEVILVDPSGEPVFDSHRSAGDTLIWAVGDITYRLESGLERGAAISLAASLR